MAQLLVETDPFHAGRWTLRCSHPAALAAVPDAIVQVLQLESESLAAWALHPDEQAGIRDAAYHDELGELGQGSLVDVVELVRPWQHNVVWVDRFHLVVGAAAPTIGSRLLGLYVGSPGRMVLSVHHPSVAALVQREIAAMPNNSAADWERMDHVSNARFVVRYDPDHRDALQVRAPQPMAMGVNDALGRLTHMVAGW